MLEWMRVRNFQKHEDVVMTFDPHVTCVIGPTEAGKSALLRALRWVCLNVPSGSAYIRNGSDGAVVSVVMDGHTIKRTRGLNENTYSLDGKEYAAFGTGVPDEIAALLAVDRINFVGQREPDFLISQSPSEAARSLNAVVDLGVIDEAHGRMSAKMHRAQEASRLAAEDVAACREQHESLQWTKECDQHLQRLEALLKKNEDIAAKHGLLRDRIDFIKQAGVQLAVATQFRAAVNVVGRKGWDCCQRLGKVSLLRGAIAFASASARMRQVASIDFRRVEVAANRISLCTIKRASLAALLRRMEDLIRLAGPAAIDFSKVVAACDVGDTVRSRRYSLGRRVRDIRDSKIQFTYLRDAAEHARQTLEKESDGVCPICGRPL